MRFLGCIFRRLFLDLTVYISTLSSFILSSVVGLFAFVLRKATSLRISNRYLYAMYRSDCNFDRKRLGFGSSPSVSEVKKLRSDGVVKGRD